MGWKGAEKRLLMRRSPRAARPTMASMSQASVSAPATRRNAVRALLEWSAIATALPGCAGYYYGEKHGPTLGSLMRENLAESSHAAARRLLRDAALVPDAKVAVQALTDIDPAGAQARFGVVVAGQLASALVQAGVPVAPPELARPAAAPAIGLPAREPAPALVGSYAVSARQVYVSLRLVQPGQKLLAAYDYAVPLDDDVRVLLQR